MNLTAAIYSASFQFHKGTIKTAVLKVDNLHTAVFQFHKGTIKTGISGEGNLPVHQFQFHKGTIKTDNAPAVCCDFANFNSIKVQLKLQNPTAYR